MCSLPDPHHCTTQGLTGSKMEKLCDAVHITLNKNAVQGDRSAVSPGAFMLNDSEFANSLVLKYL